MRNLSAKIIAIQVLFLVVALMSIGLTLLVSWQLEGGAAAINDAGSLRMRAYRLALVLSDSRDALSAAARRDLAADLQEFDSVLATLKRGDPARPLLLPANAQVACSPASRRVGRCCGRWRSAPSTACLLRSRAKMSPPLSKLPTCWCSALRTIWPAAPIC